VEFLTANVRKKVNLGPDSTGAVEPCERITASLWLFLVRKKLLLQGVLEDTDISTSWENVSSLLW